MAAVVNFLALVQECQLNDVVTYFQDAGADLTQGDLLALQRVDCIDYFGKLKGPLYYNRLCKLQEKLGKQGELAAPAPEPAPAPRPEPAAAPASAPAPEAAPSDDWGEAPIAQKPFGSALAQENTGSGGGGGGFGGGADFKAAPVQQPDIYGLRVESKGRAKCFQYAKGLCTRGADCKFVHDGAETKGSKGEYSYAAELTAHKKGPCFQFTQGSCTRGLACIFSHDPDAKPSKCGDFAKGSCTRENCRFSHDPDAPDAPRRPYTGPPVEKTEDECGQWKKGTCTRGERCKFQHVGEEGKVEKMEGECGQWKKGECTRGNACKFQHVGPGGDGGGAGGAAPRGKSSGMCRAFEAGTCTRGEGCRFSHGDGDGGASAAPEAGGASDFGSSGGGWGGAPAANEWGDAPVAVAAVDEWGAAPAPATQARPAAVSTLSDDAFADAIERDDLATVQAVIAQDKSRAVKPLNKDGDVPLFLVSSVAVAEALLRAGADVNAANTETGETPIFGISDAKLVPLFVKYSANLQHKNADGFTAEEIFAQDENNEMVNALRAAAAPAPKAKAAPARDFMVVVEEDNVAVARSMLAQNRALASKASAEGDFPLGMSSSVAMATLLLDYGADVNAANPETGETALFCISKPELIHLLLSKGANLNHRNAEGSTALEIFTEDGNDAMCVAIRNATTTTATRVSPEKFLELVENDQLDAVRAALAGNPALASTVPAGDGMYPLSVACSVPVATLLLDAKADVNAALSGETAIMCISNPALVPLLVSRGANLEHKNHDGETALDIFTADENVSMADALRAAGAAGGAGW